MYVAFRYPDLESWLREAWEGKYVTYWDANDMLALLNTWQNGDISQIRDKGDLEAALKSITAKALIMPCKTDLYFPVSSFYSFPKYQLTIGQRSLRTVRMKSSI